MSARWRLAAPSCVLPASVAENCSFLAGRVDEIGLCFFETQACLDYDSDDLPAELAVLPGRRERMRFHVHLPLDLDWSAGGADAAEACVRLARKSAFLAPWAFVLHPPEDPLHLEEFIRRWRAAGLDAGLLLFENIQGNDLAQAAPLAYAYHCGLCLDFGHALAFGQQNLLQSPQILKITRLLHLYAPGVDVRAHKHLPLTALSPQQETVLTDVFHCFPPENMPPLLLEIFDWPAWERSAAHLAHLASPAALRERL